MTDAAPKAADRLPAILAFAAGVALWLLASLASDRREAWDGPAYWSLVYPLALLIAAGLAARFPTKPWRWALLLFAGQFIGMLARNGELGGLWPLGLLLFAVLALPAVVLAQLVARWRLRRRS